MKAKSKVFIVLCVFSVFANIDLGVSLTHQTEKYEKCSLNTSSVYSYLDSITEKSFEERVLNGEKVVVYIGRPDCNDCIYFEPILQYVVEKNNISLEIKYLNAKIIREKGEKYWNEFKQKHNFTQTPAILIYDQGKCIDMIEWSPEGLSYDELLKWLQKNNIL